MGQTVTPTQLCIFAVDGNPVPQPRGRTPKDGGKPRVPKKHPVRAWKMTVRNRARMAWNGKPMQGAVQVDLVFLMPRPAYMGKGGRVPFTPKPDKDNLEKAVLDALSTVMFADDAAVWIGETRKVYAAHKEDPGVAIRVVSWDGNAMGTGWWDDVL